MTVSSDHIAELHASLDARPRPEKVAAIAARVLEGRLSDYERKMLGKAASYAERWSMMSEDWERPVDASKQVQFAQVAFLKEWDRIDPAIVRPDDTDSLRAFVARCKEVVGGDKPLTTRAERKSAGVDINHRRYNRMLRAIEALEDKIGQVAKQQTKRFTAQAGRAGLATSITLDEFRADPDAGAFVAYYVAQKNVRRQFTVEDRQNPLDTVGKMLLDRLTDTSDWWMVARAYPNVAVVARLTPEQQGWMIGEWYKVMRVAAESLEKIAMASAIDRVDYIVQRGNDSDTFNLAAGAFNMARGAWISTLAATNTLDMLETICPPKTPRLMAGDLAAWHRSIGTPKHPDVKVASVLPPAWDVVLHGVPCTKQMVYEACRSQGVPAEKSGWVGPRAPREVAQFKPAPDMVHGITVADPILGAILRRAGAWSGKGIRWEDIPEGVDPLAERTDLHNFLPPSLGDIDFGDDGRPNR